MQVGLRHSSYSLSWQELDGIMMVLYLYGSYQPRGLAYI